MHREIKDDLVELWGEIHALGNNQFPRLKKVHTNLSSAS